MEESIIYAKKYLEDLLSFFGLNTDVHATSEEDVIELSVASTHMNGFLIGQRGDTMRSLQYMVSTALKNNNYEFSRVNVDIADYKKARQDRLAVAVEQWIERVKQTGKELPLQPMNAADRRIVHKVADEHALTTESVGFGRDRHVVIKPGSFANAINAEAEDVAPLEPTKKADPEAAEETSASSDTPQAKPAKRTKPARAKNLDELEKKEKKLAKEPETKEVKPKK